MNSRLSYAKNFEPLFSRDNLTLQDVLNEEDIKSGFNNPSESMAKFFDDKRIKQLIDYIIIEPLPEAGDKEGHKYPFVSHEILKSQSSIILDHFFPSISPRKGSTNSKGSFQSKDSADNDKAALASPRSNSSRKSQVLIIDENSYHKENLDYLFSILNKHEEINCVLIGYFAKVVSSFFQKNKREICSYFYSNDQHPQSFLEHFYSKSLVDPLKNFLVIFPEDHYSHHDDSNSEAKNVQKPSPFSKFYQQRVKIFNSLFALVENSDDSDVIHNCQHIIETLVAKVDQTIDGNRLLDDVVLKKENVQVLFNCLKSVE